MNKTFCDICGKEIIQDPMFRTPTVQRITASTGNITELVLDVCKGCMKRSLRLLRKAAHQEEDKA